MPSPTLKISHIPVPLRVGEISTSRQSLQGHSCMVTLLSEMIVRVSLTIFRSKLPAKNYCQKTIKGGGVLASAAGNCLEMSSGQHMPR
jgi:hypothetical protein